MATDKMPVLRADRIYGHAAPDRSHSRDNPMRDMQEGTRTRRKITSPSRTAKRQRKMPFSGARAKP